MLHGLRMVNILPRNPGTDSEYLELHAISSLARPVADPREDYTMTSFRNTTTSPGLGDSKDTTPLRSDVDQYPNSKGTYRWSSHVGLSSVAEVEARIRQDKLVYANSFASLRKEASVQAWVFFLHVWPNQ